ncbi:LysR family transcriptional regulator [Pseudoalteromonas sp. XMcav1-K]|uniref:LysR family transcriptional regulator n=1 Tax=Pseudoalteromonas sp. XMcav1-K TaxID=3374372 RepID=UPI0037576BBB
MVSIEETKWRNVDLNLLVAFSYLYRFESVSLAAEKNFVSQSAMSHSLSRLRILLDDELFVREGHKMVATDFAHAVYPSIESMLQLVQQQVLKRDTFNANTYQGVCRIGLTDYAEYIFAPAIFDLIRTQAPNAQISFVNVNRVNYRELSEQESLDLVVGSIPNLHNAFESELLYCEQHMCLLNKEFAKRIMPITKHTLANIEHAIVSPDGSLTTQVDNLLSEDGLTRRVTVASRNFLTVQRLLLERELIAIVPKRMAEISLPNDALQSVSPPIKVPDFDISMLWLKRSRANEKHIWLRSIMKQVVS